MFKSGIERRSAGNTTDRAMVISNSTLRRRTMAISGVTDMINFNIAGTATVILNSASCCATVTDGTRGAAITVNAPATVGSDDTIDPPAD